MLDTQWAMPVGLPEPTHIKSPISIPSFSGKDLKCGIDYIGRSRINPAFLIEWLLGQTTIGLGGYFNNSYQKL